MPEYVHSGVFIEEIERGPKPIEGVPTSTAAFVGTSEAIKLKLAPLTLEEQTRIWHAVLRPYRLSVTYDALVIRIDSNDVTVRRSVLSRTLVGAIGDGA